MSSDYCGNCIGMIQRLDISSLPLNPSIELLQTYRVLFKMFSKPWKVSFGNITLMAMLAYDLQRYHPKFCVDVVDQVLENIRAGMEQNIYKDNQKRVATIRYLGELYIYRLVNSRVIFDTFWTLVTFGHSMLVFLFDYSHLTCL
jgi:hypothetical protein